MAREEAPIYCECSRCGTKIEIENIWEAANVNDVGLILRCLSCGHVFDIHIGRDVKSSRVIAGATLLARYDSHVKGDRSATLKKYGINPE
jgi:uncharacterized Zn finger protein